MTLRRRRGVDGGFTLIELLVVMIVIGILAAIAVPVLIGQRRKAVDTSMTADLRDVAALLEDRFADHHAFAAVSQSGRIVSVAGGGAVSVSGDTSVTAVGLSTATAATSWATADGYCLTATNPQGSSAAGVVHNSLAGGLTSTSCPQP